MERKIAERKTDTVAIIDPRHAAKAVDLRENFPRRHAGRGDARVVDLGAEWRYRLGAPGAWPAISHFGFSFVTREIWNPVTDEYGAPGADFTGRWSLSLIAMLLAVPAGFGIALFPDRTSVPRC